MFSSLEVEETILNISEYYNEIVVLCCAEVSIVLMVWDSVWDFFPKEGENQQKSTNLWKFFFCRNSPLQQSEEVVKLGGHAS